MHPRVHVYPAHIASGDGDKSRFEQHQAARPRQRQDRNGGDGIAIARKASDQDCDAETISKANGLSSPKNVGGDWVITRTQHAARQ